MKSKKKKNNEEAKKGLFMKIIIIYCLTFIAVTNIWALFILKDTGRDAYGIINSINLVHGGELLLCCVKRVISGSSKSDNKTNKISNKISNIVSNKTNISDNNNLNSNENDINTLKEPEEFTVDVANLDPGGKIND